MTEQYTPTTEEVRDSYRYSYQRPDICGKDFGLEFDRWLAEHDRHIAERAWQEGHGDPECDKWTVSGMCAEYHPNPYRKAVQS